MMRKTILLLATLILLTLASASRCGKKYGQCPKGQCCSKYGFCGKGKMYCGVGCNSEFGACDSAKATITKTRIVKSTPSPELIEKIIEKVDAIIGDVDAEKVVEEVNDAIENAVIENAVNSAVESELENELEDEKEENGDAVVVNDGNENNDVELEADEMSNDDEIITITEVITEKVTESPENGDESEKSDDETTTKSENPVPTTTSEKPEQTTTSEKPEQTTTSEKPEQTTTSEKPEQTTTSEKPEQTTTSEKPEQTTTSEKPEQTTTSEKPEQTTTSEKPEQTTTSEKPEQTTTSEKPEQTTTSEKPEQTTTSEKPEQTTTSEKPEQTTTSEKPEQTTTSEKPEQTTTSEKPEQTTSEKPEQTTTSEKPVQTTTTEAPVQSTTTEEVVTTVIITESTVTITTEAPVVATTTTEAPVITTTSEAPVTTTTTKAPVTTTTEAPAPTGECSTEVFGIVSKFNAFFFGDFTGYSSDVQGRLAAKGTVDISGGYQSNAFVYDAVAHQHQSNYGCEESELKDDFKYAIVAGTINFRDGGEISNGGIAYTNSANLPGYITDSIKNKKCPNEKKEVINFDTEKENMVKISNKLTNFAENCKKTHQWGKLTVDLVQGQKTCYVTIDDLSQINNIVINENGTSDVTIVFNIKGEHVTFTNFDIFNLNKYATRILWNAPNATKLTIQNFRIQGTLLAPNADIEGNNSNIQGQIIGKSLKGNMQMDWVPFYGCI